MGKALKIDFIGAGNLAWNLAPALENAGSSVINVYSKNPDNAKKLAGKLYEGQVKTDLNFSETEADIILIAITDDEIEEVAKEVVLPEDILIAHTSGSIPLAKLGYSATPNIGVFYPLQTFTKNQQANFKEIPILIEGENKKTTDRLAQLAKTLSGNVSVITSTQRQQLHLAAVFANNFTNWMLTQSEEIIQNAKLDLSMLKPLLEQSISNAIRFGPKNVQTGPAKRGDYEVLDKQMELLTNQPKKEELYKLVSQQILDFYQTQSNE
ncbi:MAG: F420-dependent NADP oxidoreductase [Cyclobacteriaceae bacterium]|nr:F420-dependent NADP oxidoreductase [Cyclobacteriaceae bacterium]